MRKVFSSVLATILIVSSMVVPAMGQDSNKTQLVVNVPFEFTTATGTMPAGQYAVIRVIPSYYPVIMQLRSADGHTNTMLEMNPLIGKIQDGSQLIFTHVGSRYYLSEMWTAGSSTGLQAVKSKAEKEETKSRKPVEKVAVALSPEKR